MELVFFYKNTKHQNHPKKSIINNNSTLKIQLKFKLYWILLKNQIFLQLSKKVKQ